MSRRFLISVLVLLAAMLASPGSAPGQAGGGAFPADQVQAAFVFRFIEHSTWPADAFESADSPIRIAVLGLDGPVALLRQFVAGEQVNNRSIDVQGYTYPAPEGDAQSQREEVSALFSTLAQSHVLYISPSAREHVEEIVRRLDGGRVLTVADADVPRAASRGAMLGFVLRDGKIKFEANLKSIRRAKVKVSPDLLKLPVKTY